MKQFSLFILSLSVVSFLGYSFVSHESAKYESDGVVVPIDQFTRNMVGSNSDTRYLLEAWD